MVSLSDGTSTTYKPHIHTWIDWWNTRIIIFNASNWMSKFVLSYLEWPSWRLPFKFPCFFFGYFNIWGSTATTWWWLRPKIITMQCVHYTSGLFAFGFNNNSFIVIIHGLKLNTMYTKYILYWTSCNKTTCF